MDEPAINIKLPRRAGGVYCRAEVEEAYRHTGMSMEPRTAIQNQMHEIAPGRFDVDIGAGDVLNLGCFRFAPDSDLWLMPVLPEDVLPPASTIWTAGQYSIAVYRYGVHRLGLKETWEVPVTGELRVWYTVDPWYINIVRTTEGGDRVVVQVPNPIELQVSVNGDVVRSLSRRMYQISGHLYEGYAVPSSLWYSISIQVKAGDIVRLSSYSSTSPSWQGTAGGGATVDVPNTARISMVVCPRSHNPELA